MHRFLSRCLTRTPILGVLMAALVFRALIPAGFMPAPGENGRLVMELCAGFTTKSVVVNLDEGERNATGSELFDRSPCGFTAAAVPAPPPVPVSWPVSLTLHVQVGTSAIPHDIAPASRRAHAPRAPPLA